MDISLSPREIQTRIRSGASLSEVAGEAGVSEDRIAGFAAPVLAEREYMATTALAATIRRRGDTVGHRRLRDIIGDRLKARKIDPDAVAWDAWRLPDLRWRVRGVLAMEAGSREANFSYDPKGRFSVAENNDARWMIGEELPGRNDPDNENTVDFDDEYALVRAVQEPTEMPDLPGDDIPEDSLYGAATDGLDELYEMLSVVSEDSVRIYVGLNEAAPNLESVEDEDEPQRSEPDDEPSVDETELATPSTPIPAPENPVQAQEALLGDTPPEEPKKPKTRRKRASVPTWDEIMFGGGKK